MSILTIEIINYVKVICTINISLYRLNILNVSFSKETKCKVYKSTHFIFDCIYIHKKKGKTL